MPQGCKHRHTSTDEHRRAQTSTDEQRVSGRTRPQPSALSPTAGRRLLSIVCDQSSKYGTRTLPLARGSSKRDDDAAAAAHPDAWPLVALKEAGGSCAQRKLPHLPGSRATKRTPPAICRTRTGCGSDGGGVGGGGGGGDDDAHTAGGGVGTLITHTKTPATGACEWGTSSLCQHARPCLASTQ